MNGSYDEAQVFMLYKLFSVQHCEGSLALQVALLQHFLRLQVLLVVQDFGVLLCDDLRRLISGLLDASTALVRTTISLRSTAAFPTREEVSSIIFSDSARMRCCSGESAHGRPRWIERLSLELLLKPES